MTGQGLAFKRMQWCIQNEVYSFDVDPEGHAATFVAPDGRTMKLSISAWEGLLKTIALAEPRQPAAAQQRAPPATATAPSHVAQSQPKPVATDRPPRDLPPRAGAKWTGDESDDLRRAFEAGTLVADLARTHARTPVAIRYQLVKMGLVDNSFVG